MHALCFLRGFYAIYDSKTSKTMFWSRHCIWHTGSLRGGEVNVGGGGGLGENMDLKAMGVWYIRSAHGETP